MSKNLRGNARTFDFSKADPKSNKRAPIIFEPASTDDNDTEPTLVLPKFGNKKKKEMKFPELQEPSNVLENLIKPEETGESKLPEQSTKNSRTKVPKRNLFILSDETTSADQLPHSLEKRIQPIDVSEALEAPDEDKLNVELGNKEIIENKVEENAAPLKKSSAKPSFRNKKLAMGDGLGLDIDTINEEFDIGGEKGKRIAQDPIEDFIKEISELAKECVQFMKGEKVQTDFYQNKMPEVVREETQAVESISDSTPVIGDIQNIKTLRKKPDRTFSKKIQIETFEGIEPGQTEKSEAAQNQLSASEQQKVSNEEQKIEDPIAKSDLHPIMSQLDGSPENFYQSLLEWLLHKPSTQSDGSMIIDETDQINSLAVIEVIIELYPMSNELAKQKIIQDLYMLVKWNDSNSQAFLNVPEFIPFLLDILVEFQFQLFNSELPGVSSSIWELGSKIHTILLRYAVLNEVDIQKRFQDTFVWLENSRKKAAATAKSDEAEKASGFLVRHLWSLLLDSLVETSHTVRPDLQSSYWRNIGYVVFYTQEIVISSHVEMSMSSTNRQISENSYSTIGPLVTRITHTEQVPLNFKETLKETSWLDWKIVENLARILDNLCTEAILPPRNCTDQKEIETKLSESLDISQSEEHLKIFQLFTFEPYVTSEPTRGCFLKVVTILYVNALEDAIRNKNLELAKSYCLRLENMLKYNLLVAENCRDKTLTAYIQSQALSIDAYIISLLYRFVFSDLPEESKSLVRQSIRSSMIYLLCLIDFLNSHNGSFSTYESTRKKSIDRGSINDHTATITNETESENVCPFTLLTFELFKCILSANFPQPLMLIAEIRQQKNKKFSDIDAVIFDTDWYCATTENYVVLDLIKNYFGESYIKINKNIFSNLQTLASKSVSARETSQKKTRKVAKSWEDIIHNRAAKIHELEDVREHEITALDEECMRIAKSLWRKVWKRQRVYSGQWRHPSFYDQRDEKYKAQEWDDIKKSTIFYHKMSKFETEARARPFLKLKLIEPSYVIQYQNDFREKRQRRQLVSVNTDIFPKLGVQNLYIPMEKTSPVLVEKEANKSFSITKIGKDFFKKAFMTTESSPQNDQAQSERKKMQDQKIAQDSLYSIRPTQKDEIFLTKKAQWIKALTFRAGFVQITSSKLVFIFDGLYQKPNKVAFVPFKLAEDKRIIKEWPLDHITELQKRRYITRKTALEIFLIDGSSLLFNFPNGDYEELSQKLASMRKTRIPDLIFYNTLDPRKILERAALTKRWQTYEISNFEYLMALNSLAGRSYKDLTQYQVFPWILAQYSSDVINLDDSASYRDLSKPMGALGGEERIKTFQDRFENMDLFNSTPRFHFGSHYSSPGTVLQYLIRLYPYTQGAKELQGGKFDLADRLFFSIEESYNAATSEIADVRELIPEFYFLPEFLYNKEKLDFGVMQTGMRVNHVQMPKWSRFNPYRFVTILRIALESDIVSKNLHQWIDLIFGYKQRGKEAEIALNTFYYLTYEDMIDLDKISDPNTRAATETQLIHFGQTPSQLFLRPHPQRLNKETLMSYKIIADPTADIRFYRPSSKKKIPLQDEQFSIFDVQGKSLVKLKFINETRLIGIRRDGTITYYRWWNSNNNPTMASNIPFSCGVEKEKPVQLEKIKNEAVEIIDRSLALLSYPVILLDDGKLMLYGGVWGGRLFVLTAETDQILETYYNHTDTVSALSTNKEETYLISGSKCGECFLWKITSEKRLSLKFQFYDHEAAVSSVFIASELVLFASAGHDGRINLYNLHTGNLMRSIYHPQLRPIDSLVLSSCPLAAVIFSSIEDKKLYSYSINGQLLEIIKEETHSNLSPIIIKDLNKIEYLVYGNYKGELFIRELPFLTLRKKFTAAKDIPILSILLSTDERYLLCGCGDGEISVLTDPNYTVITPTNSATSANLLAQSSLDSGGRISIDKTQPITEISSTEKL